MKEIWAITPLVRVANTTVIGAYDGPRCFVNQVIGEDQLSNTKVYARVVNLDRIEVQRRSGDEVWQTRFVQSQDINNDPDLIGRFRFMELKEVFAPPFYFRFM